MQSRLKIHYGWIVIFTGLLITIGAHGFGRMSYSLLLPAMRDGLDLNYSQLGLIGTGNFVGYLIMALFGGILAARFGSRLVITLALGLMGVTLILTGFTNGPGHALAMRFLTGLGNGAAYVPAMALGSIWFAANRRGFATGIVSAGIGGGTMIAGLLVPVIMNAYGGDGWRYGWYWLGAGVLLIAVITAVFLRNKPEDSGIGPVGGTTTPASENQPKVSSLDWGSIYKQPAVWYLGVVYFMYGFSYVIYLTFFVAYLTKEMGLSSSQAGNLWAMLGGFSIFCGLIWGSISDWLGRGKGSALAYITLAASYLVFALVKNNTGFIISTTLFGFTAWSIPTIMAAAAGDEAGPGLAPACLGFITLFFGLGQALGPYVGGRLADAAGSFTGPFILAAIVSIVGCVLSLGIKKRE